MKNLDYRKLSNEATALGVKILVMQQKDWKNKRLHSLGDKASKRINRRLDKELEADVRMAESNWL